MALLRLFQKMDKSNTKLLIHMSDAPIEYLRANDKRLQWLINKIGNLECNIHDDDFQFIVEQIVGQMLSNKVADIFVIRLIELCNGKINLEAILKVNENDLQSIGLARSKCKYIKNFAEKVASGEINLDSLHEKDDTSVIAELTEASGMFVGKSPCL